MKNYQIVGYGKKVESDELKGFKRPKDVSVVVPTYNEKENIRRLVEEIVENLGKTEFGKSYEIVIVDDNSQDGTQEIIDKLAEKFDLVALHRYGKRGLFSAILDGIEVANGKKVMTMDADFSHPPKLIPPMLKYAKEYDIVTASRYVRGGDMRAPAKRKYGSMGLNWICSSILGLNVRDIGGEFRVFDKEKTRPIKYRYECMFAEYSMEFFYRAKKLGLSVKEIPLIYKFREAGVSKTNDLFKTAVLGYIKRAFQLRFENVS